MPLHGKFRLLEEFCVGSVSVFSGTATVESDFSIINSELNAGRSRLTDIALEGILHAKQWQSVRRLCLEA